MNTSRDGIERIRAREGSRSQMYLDQAGLPTIGVGHLLTKDELSSGKIQLPMGPVDWHQGLADDQVDDLLREDLDNAENAVDRLPIPLLQYQFDTLVSFVFNVGVGAFNNSTLRKKLVAGDFASVPEQLRRWVYAGGHVDAILEKRREDEISQWNGS